MARMIHRDPVFLVDITVNGKKKQQLEIVARDAGEAKMRAASQIVMKYQSSWYTCHVAGMRAR